MVYTVPSQNARQVWQTALGELQLQMARGTFETWLQPTTALGYQDGALVIGVRNAYAKEWLENRLQETIRRTLQGLVGQPVETRFVVRSGSDAPGALAGRPIAPIMPGMASDPSPTPAGSPPPTDPAPVGAPARPATPQFAGRAAGPALNPKYTFQTFIVGNSNRLAHAACMAVAERPAEAYNPLFIYGGTGLGKTHLLEAVGWVPFLQSKTVVYVSSETFTNDLINAIRTQSTEDFRQAYRRADVLLIDDIQFIAGKETTQEEFFHTFNSLHSANKQIVLSSDRHPRAIPTLEERLRSRFEGGLIADIQPPDLETRIAILRAKSEGQPLAVPDAVIEFIARKVQSNVREMSGALTRCIAYAQLMNLPLTVEMAGAMLQELLQHQTVTMDQVLEAVADFYRVSLQDLKGRSRAREIVLPRQMAMYLLREETGASLPQIGEALGGRDHTTVLYSVEKIGEEVETDDQRRKEMLAVKERLYQSGRKL